MIRSHWSKAKNLRIMDRVLDKDKKAHRTVASVDYSVTTLTVKVVFMDGSSEVYVADEWICIEDRIDHANKE